MSHSESISSNTNQTEETADINTKLKILGEVMDDLATTAPHTLKTFLQGYWKYFRDNDTHKSGTDSKSMQVESGSQTDSPKDQNAWNLESIADDVTTIAKKVTEETGFSYDDKSGWYFDHKMNCYYNANCRLYYYSEHQAYYYFDEESQSLQYYCSLSSQSQNSNMTTVVQASSSSSPLSEKDILDKEESLKNEIPFAEGLNKTLVDETCKEEGECSDSDGEIPRPEVIEAGPTVFEPNNTKHFAPCIRIVVKKSELSNILDGTLFIVTCTGGTIGREGDHDVLLPDFLVSKVHSKFQYVSKDGSHVYELIDLGSKNGTFLNGKRLSDALVQSEPVTITHGSIVTVGHTELLCHIHHYDETCEECAPFSNTKETKKVLENGISLKEKHSLENASLRKKFGLSNHLIIKLPDGYEDRAQIRRKQVGSSHPSEKTETASINEPICKKNKGFALLSKMGWEEGKSLGIRNNGAALEPIIPTERQKNSGLGCDSVISLEKSSKKRNLALKTMERYNQVS